MLRLSKTLLNRPVMSLRLGGQIAVAVEPIINPHNLKIMGWWCKAPGHVNKLVLLSEDVREIMPTGLAVNDDDAMIEPHELVRHKEILGINFSLIGKTVKTKSSKIGKVDDYSYNDGLFVQKLYVAKPLIKLLAAEDMSLIDRSQILEVTDKYILVKGSEVTEGEEEMAAAGAAVPA